MTLFAPIVLIAAAWFVPASIASCLSMAGALTIMIGTWLTLALGWVSR